MFQLKRVRPIDAAIIGVAVLVLAVAGWLGYSVWAQNRAVNQSMPASRAVDELITKLRKNPNDIDVRMQLAQALSVAGRDREAAEQYKTVLKVRKDYTPALSGLGFIYLKERQWQTGEGYFRRVVSLLEGKAKPGTDSTLETAYFYLGTALMEQKKYEEAIPNLKQAIRYRRDASDTHYALSVAYREVGSDAKAREELEATLLFDPKMPEANYDLGEVLLKAGDKAGAAERFRMSVDSAPAVEAPQKALDALGPFSDRMTAARKLKESDPAKALVEARIAVAINPRDAGALVLLGDLYAATGDKSAAEANYRRALGIAPDDASAKAGLERVTNAK